MKPADISQANWDASQKYIDAWNDSGYPTLDLHIETLARLFSDAYARGLEDAIGAVGHCGSLDNNGYICAKSEAIFAIRALGSK